MSAAITSTDGLVFAGSLDGNLNVYDSVSGEIIWSFDTFGDFESVSGDMALGGSIESDGPVLYEGHCAREFGLPVWRAHAGQCLNGLFALSPYRHVGQRAA